jgi:hypothetical protein
MHSNNLHIYPIEIPSPKCSIGTKAKGWEIWVNECLKNLIVTIFEAYTFQ